MPLKISQLRLLFLNSVDWEINAKTIKDGQSSAQLVFIASLEKVDVMFDIRKNLTDLDKLEQNL